MEKQSINNGETIEQWRNNGVLRYTVEKSLKQSIIGITMDLNDLEVYKLSREIGKDAWKIYNGFDWKIKKILGDQFIRAVDSVAANVAEGFGRFHYLDRNRFNYNARGSLIGDEEYVVLNKKFKNLMVKLNNYIVATKALKK